MTRGRIFDKIIKLSERHAGTKKRLKRSEGSQGNGQKKRFEKVKKVLDKLEDTRYNIKAR